MEEIAEEKPAPVEQPKKKGCCTCLNCFLILLGLFLICFLGLASLVSATGLVKIPVLSSIFYKEPQVAEVKILTQEDLLKKFEPYFVELQKKRKLPAEIEIELTDEEATGYLIGFLKEYFPQTKEGPKLEKLQLLFKKDEVTALLLVNFPPLSPKTTFLQNKVWITCVFYPEFVPGKINFVVKKIKMGSLPLPKSSPNLILSLLRLPTKGLSYNVEGLKTLSLSSGKIKIVLEGKVLEKYLKERK